MEHVGSGLTREMLEVRGLRIDPVHRADEPDLMRSRWFDYEGMHPVETTYLFAHFYKRESARFYEQSVDIRTVESARAFTPDDIFMSRDLTSMWLARKCADGLGMPYDTFLGFARERAFARYYLVFPRPNQLYGEEVELDVGDAWRDLVGRSLRYSRQGRYKASAWTGADAQRRHVEFVVGQIQKRPAPRAGLIARMFDEDILSPALIREFFPEDDIERAKALQLKLE